MVKAKNVRKALNDSFKKPLKIDIWTFCHYFITSLAPKPIKLGVRYFVKSHGHKQLGTTQRTFKFQPPPMAFIGLNLGKSYPWKV